MASKVSRLRTQRHAALARSRCEFSVECGKRQPSSLRKLQIQGVINGQVVAIGKFDRVVQSGRPFGVVDELQGLQERQCSRSFATIDAPASRRHCEPIRKLGAKDEGYMAAQSDHLIQDGIRSSTTFVRQRPCKRHGVVDDDAQ